METVVIYTTPTCPWCTKVKTYLNEKGVNYREIDVAQDEDAAQHMLEVTGQRSVPVVARGTEFVVGFNPEQINRIIQ